MSLFYWIPLSFVILGRLWSGRDRPALFGQEWWRAWAKRLFHLPAIFRQGWFHAQLIRRGARVSSLAFFSDPKMIIGKLELLVVGDFSFVGRAHLAVHAPVWIGSRVCINDGAQLLSASHDVTHPHWPAFARPIRVEDHAWVATNAMILPGVTIGQGGVVGAGAVVTRDVPDHAVAVGNPARNLPEHRSATLDYSPTASLAMFTAWRKMPLIRN